MKKYEIMFILRPDMSEAEAISEMDEIKAKITKKNGKVLAFNIWQRRQLAYPMKKFQEGIYVLGDFEMPESASIDLAGEWKLDANILRFLIVKKES
ncbi:MAG: 30S ribosomal protein S6 [Candidatus Omnitrophica bacterium]|nr:30S ribosomal protein S6 [Candidatus Omnitrophota bacterium]